MPTLVTSETIIDDNEGVNDCHYHLVVVSSRSSQSIKIYGLNATINKSSSADWAHLDSYSKRRSQK